jgi:hypothetical protein
MRKNNSIAIGTGLDWNNWLQAYIPAGWFAFGPNADEGWDVIPMFVIPVKFGRYHKFPWFRPTGWLRIPFPLTVKKRWRRFPKLLLGYGVTRWMAERDKEVLFVNSLHGKWTGSLAFWGRNKKFQTTLMSSANSDPDFKETLDGYGPSPIQYYSPIGFALTWPLHLAVWYQWDRKMMIGNREIYENIIFGRIGARWDSLDDFQDCPTAFLGGTFN